MNEIQLPGELWRPAGREVGALIPTKSKICIEIYSQPSISVGPTFMDSKKLRIVIFF